MEEASTEALSERIFTEMVGAMSLLAEYLGHRLALFKMKNLVKSSYPLRQALMLSLFGILTSIMIYVSASDASEYEILVLGTVEETISVYKQADFWGEVDRSKPLDVPRAIIVVINQSWREEAKQVSVDVKKELFFRGLVPLILYANELIIKDRARLESLMKIHKEGQAISVESIQWLRGLAARYGLIDPESPPGDRKLLSLMDDLFVRVDIIPPSLALGQGAYESGYGTSRFALLGNALYGQWTYGGKGMKPKEQRKSKGDYGVASYLWPFDSVRGYMRNLNTHRVYEDLRLKRAELRQRNVKITGIVLAETLTKYSEKGQAYIDTLKSIIKKNELGIADDARLRDEQTILIVGAEDEEDKTKVQSEIEGLRASGRLAEIIQSMRLDEL